MANERPKPRTVTGTVVSDKMDKTITVRDERLVKHPLYGKYVRRSTKYLVHDGRNEAEAGDRVEIVLTRPMSKTKHWRLLRVLTRSGERHQAEAEAATASEAGVGATEPAAVDAPAAGEEPTS